MTLIVHVRVKDKKVNTLLLIDWVTGEDAKLLEKKKAEDKSLSSIRIR